MLHLKRFITNDFKDIDNHFVEVASSILNYNDLPQPDKVIKSQKSSFDTVIFSPANCLTCNLQTANCISLNPYMFIIANHVFESASFLYNKERIDENRP